jgi:hypothetical protein
VTVVRTITCDYCNPERECPEPTLGDGVGESKMWTRVMGEKDSPLGWWDVPGKGADGERGHACPSCMMADDRSVFNDVSARRHAETVELTGVDPT